MKFLFLLLISPLCFAAQPAAVSPKQITGLWKGFFTTTDVRVPYELVFSEENGKITGWSYTTFSVEGAEIVTMKKLTVKFTGFVITEDDNDVYNNFPQANLRKIKQLNTLSLEVGTTSSKLTGTFETSTPRSLKSAKGTIFLEKKNTPDSSSLIAKMDELDITRTLSFSFSAPPIKEPDAASIAVNEQPMPEKMTFPAVIPNIPGIDTVETFEAAVLNKPVLVNVAVITSTPYKTIEPAMKKTQAPAVVIAAIKPVVTAPMKPVAVVPEIAIAKTNPQVIPAKPRTDAIVAKPPPPAPVVKAKIIDPVKKETLPPVAVVKVVPKILPDNIAIAPAIDLKNRKIEIIDQLTIMADSLMFTLYDNGEVDGDTVSIILNGKTIVFRQGLSTKPFTKTIYLTQEMGDSVQLIMYAENLGRIPPNTGLMILNFDNKRREVRFSGDLSKNAAITLRRKEKE